MRVGFAGTPEVALPALDALATSHHELVAVLTRPDAPVGRGRRRAASPVAARAAELGLPLLQPHTLRDDAVVAALAELRLDAVAVVAYGLIIPPAALAAARHGWVNLHFSLLPAWRGAAPVQRALMAGDEVTGACTFRIEQGLDTGPVFGQLTERIAPTDTAGDLLDRLSRAGAGLLVDTLDAIESGVARPVAQSDDGVSHAPKVSVDDARVEWTAPAYRVDRSIRACTPRPGAWTTIAGRRLKLGPVRQVDDAVRLAAGEVAVERDRIVVGCGTGAVRLGQVAPEGKGPMDAVAWWRGARLDAGVRFDAAAGAGVTGDEVPDTVTRDQGAEG